MVGGLAAIALFQQEFAVISRIIKYLSNVKVPNWESNSSIRSILGEFITHHCIKGKDSFIF